MRQAREASEVLHYKLHECQQPARSGSQASRNWRVQADVGRLVASNGRFFLPHLAIHARFAHHPAGDPDIGPAQLVFRRRT
jgi:hypothetical protein